MKKKMVIINVRVKIRGYHTGKGTTTDSFTYKYRVTTLQKAIDVLQHLEDERRGVISD